MQTNAHRDETFETLGNFCFILFVAAVQLATRRLTPSDEVAVPSAAAFARRKPTQTTTLSVFKTSNSRGFKRHVRLCGTGLGAGGEVDSLSECLPHGEGSLVNLSTPV